MTLRTKFYTVISVTALSLGITSTVQAIEITGNLAATSTYMWRGVPLSTGAAAIQGGGDVIIPIGGVGSVHVGGWTSNVTGGTELDIISGFSGKFKGFEYDAGLILYRYPQGASSANFEELYAGVSQGSLSAKFSTSSDNGEYIEAAAGFPIATWQLTAHVGNYIVKNGSDYADFSATFTKPMPQGFDLSFMISDTTISSDDYRTTITLSTAFKP